MKRFSKKVTCDTSFIASMDDLSLIFEKYIKLVNFGEADNDALEQIVVAAARIETWNMDKTRAKREPVAKEKLWVHRPPPEPEHVKLVGEWNCALKSAKKDGRRWSFEIKQ